MDTKQITDITEADIQALKENKVSERTVMEYKRDLPGSRDSDKKEFLYDVSSFANARGGHLIFGIEEEGGIPKDIPSLSVPDTDAEKRRWQSLILDGVEPRMPGVELHFVPCRDSKHILVIRIPKSWSLPHMVTIQGVNKFYTRNSAGKHPVDVGELRALFAQSGEISERLKRFRAERLSQIIAGETPVQLEPEPKMVLHVLPFESFALGPRIDLKAAQVLPNGLLTPLGEGGYSTRVNIDGLLLYTNGFEKTSSAYLQLYRKGIIETVNARVLSAHSRSGVPALRGVKLIPSIAFERYLLTQIPAYLKALHMLGIQPPFAVMLTLLGVKDCWMALNAGIGGGSKMDRNDLIIPEILIEKIDCRPMDIKPLLDAVWNAGGHFESPNFDASGNWAGSQ
ncbi:MAG TPA: ATP-binding protein [Verrucomicrobiae bacterium]|nr:ATP-binding protein [Verrucomicrobiae bacterium]